MAYTIKIYPELSLYLEKVKLIIWTLKYSIDLPKYRQLLTGQ